MAYVAVVGSRSVSFLVPAQVRSVVSCLTARGYGIGSGGALGADQCALVSLLAVATPAVLAQSRLYLAWVCSTSLPVSVQGSVGHFTALGGQVIPGWAAPRAPYRLVVQALQARSRLLVGHQHCRAVVAFFGPGRCLGPNSAPHGLGRNRGTSYTVLQALARHRPVFAVGGLPLGLSHRVRQVAGTVGRVAGVWLLPPGYRWDFGR